MMSGLAQADAAAAATLDPQLSVVIPVRNEAKNVAALAGEIAAALDGVVAYEIVFVDDGSADDTAARIAGLDSAAIRLIRHERSCGQSAAVRTGIRQSRGRCIATLDGDGQNDPADIPALYRELLSTGRQQPILVAGNRTARRDTATKRLSSRLANRVRAGLLRDGTHDSGCGLKAFWRDDFLLLPYFDHMHRFLPALFIREGGRVISIAVNHRPRGGGRSNYGTFDRLWVGIWDLLGVMWLQRRARLPKINVEKPMPQIVAEPPLPPGTNRGTRSAS